MVVTILTEEARYENWRLEDNESYISSIFGLTES